MSTTPTARMLPKPPPMFREGGQLWVDPSRLVRRTAEGAEVSPPFADFDVFEYAGRLYEVWGKRADGCLWVGLMTAQGIPRAVRRLIAGQS